MFIYGGDAGYCNAVQRFSKRIIFIFFRIYALEENKQRLEDIFFSRYYYSQEHVNPGIKIEINIFISLKNFFFEHKYRFYFS